MRLPVFVLIRRMGEGMKREKVERSIKFRALTLKGRLQDESQGGGERFMDVQERILSDLSPESQVLSLKHVKCLIHLHSQLIRAK